MEIADVFVVNKADRDGADRLVSSIEAKLALHACADADWRPPMVKTMATDGAVGVPELWEPSTLPVACPSRVARAATPARGISPARNCCRNDSCAAHLARHVLVTASSPGGSRGFLRARSTPRRRPSPCWTARWAGSGAELGARGFAVESMPTS